MTSYDYVLTTTGNEASNTKSFPQRGKKATFETQHEHNHFTEFSLTSKDKSFGNRANDKSTEINSFANQFWNDIIFAEQGNSLEIFPDLELP